MGAGKSQIRMLSGIVLGLIGLIWILCISTTVEGGTIIVSQDGSGDYASIQDAVNHSSDGDTIRVWEGTYNENVVIDRTVDIIGNGSEETTIDGGGMGDVVVVTSDGVNISGFLVTGSGDYHSGNDNSGIKVKSNRSRVADCEFTDITYGILILSSSHNVISNNICTEYHVGISIRGDQDRSVDRTCTQNTIADNTCTGPGRSGITIVRSHNNTLMRNIFMNHGQEGIFISSSHGTTIVNSTTSDNKIGIEISGSYGPHTVHNNNIFRNTWSGILVFSNDDQVVFAENNWWGSSSGPYHPSLNPHGDGEEVTDDVLFEPWLDEVVTWGTTAMVDSISPKPAIFGEETRFHGIGLSFGTITRFVWESSIDGELNNETEGNFTTTTLSRGTHTISFKVQDDQGKWSHPVTTTLIVHERPVAFIEGITPNPGREDKGVTFNGSATDDGVFSDWEWWSSIDHRLKDEVAELKHYLHEDHSLRGSVSEEGSIWVRGDYDQHPGTRTNRREVDVGTWEINDRTVSIDDRIRITLALRERDEGFTNNPNFHLSIYHDGIKLNEIKIGPETKPNETKIINHSLGFSEPIISTPDMPLQLNIMYTGWEDCDILLGDGEGGSYITFTGVDLNPTTTGLSEGEHVISFRVCDDHGAWSERVNTTLTILENLKPTVTVTSHENRSEVWGIIEVNGTALDPDGDVVRVELALDGHEGWETADGAGSWTYSLNTDSLSTGDHKLYIRSFDGHKYSDINCLKFKVTEGEDEGKDDGGFLPGFELLVCILALSLAGIMKRKVRVRFHRIPLPDHGSWPASGLPEAILIRKFDV